MKKALIILLFIGLNIVGFTQTKSKYYHILGIDTLKCCQTETFTTRLTDYYYNKGIKFDQLEIQGLNDTTFNFNYIGLYTSEYDKEGTWYTFEELETLIAPKKHVSR
jgi:hypothetical protein